MGEWQVARLQFAVDHPVAAGHFPGDPILPGALLLDEVIAAIIPDADQHPITIRAAKFLRIVRPGACLDLRWQASPGNQLKFECRLAGSDDLACTGTFEAEKS